MKLLEKTSGSPRRVLAACYSWLRIRKRCRNRHWLQWLGLVNVGWRLCWWLRGQWAHVH